jgi:pantoate--beta-alanine ligase
MLLIERIAAMRRWSETERRQGRRIVFVPTMGFLHEGHLCLVRDAKKRGDRVVVSIFVNPTQFSPGEDFAAYPRDFGRDCELLEKEEIDVLFHPSVEEMYPAGGQTHVEVERLSLPLCGAARPGHFRGVATVVTKLFNIVGPQAAIFGEKDYQQLQVIRQMARDLCMDIEIVGHPIVREADGLALSSRNVYLTDEERRRALALSRGLMACQELFSRGEEDPERYRAVLRSVGGTGVELEYAEVVDPATLSRVERVEAGSVCAIAARVGATRLIDNVVLGS